MTLFIELLGRRAVLISGARRVGIQTRQLSPLVHNQDMVRFARRVREPPPPQGLKGELIFKKIIKNYRVGLFVVQEQKKRLNAFIYRFGWVEQQEVGQSEIKSNGNANDKVLQQSLVLQTGARAFGSGGER